MSEAVTSDKQKAGTTCQAESMVALPEQKAFFPPHADRLVVDKIPAISGRIRTAQK